jgi:hypothetical protein
MTKRLDRHFMILKIMADFIIIFSSFFIAKEIRLHTDLIPNVQLPIQTLANNYLINYAII